MYGEIKIKSHSPCDVRLIGRPKTISGTIDDLRGTSIKCSGNIISDEGQGLQTLRGALTLL